MFTVVIMKDHLDCYPFISAALVYMRLRVHRVTWYRIWVSWVFFISGTSERGASIVSFCVENVDTDQLAKKAC